MTWKVRRDQKWWKKFAPFVCTLLLSISYSWSYISVLKITNLLLLTVQMFAHIIHYARSILPYLLEILLTTLTKVFYYCLTFHFLRCFNPLLVGQNQSVSEFLFLEFYSNFNFSSNIKMLSILKYKYTWPSSDTVFLYTIRIIDNKWVIWD